MEGERTVREPIRLTARRRVSPGLLMDQRAIERLVRALAGALADYARREIVAASEEGSRSKAA